MDWQRAKKSRVEEGISTRPGGGGNEFGKCMEQINQTQTPNLCLIILVCTMHLNFQNG